MNCCKILDNHCWAENMKAKLHSDILLVFWNYYGTDFISSEPPVFLIRSSISSILNVGSFFLFIFHRMGIFFLNYKKMDMMISSNLKFLWRQSSHLVQCCSRKVKTTLVIVDSITILVDMEIWISRLAIRSYISTSSLNLFGEKLLVDL